jgi:HlyD family secretion protein
LILLLIKSSLQLNFLVTKEALAGAELRTAEGELVPGMPVEAFIRTEQRTMLSYLPRVAHRLGATAFREQ